MSGGEQFYFRCVCGTEGANLDDGREMIECEQCHCWAHTSCHRIKGDMSSARFICGVCTGAKPNLHHMAAAGNLSDESTSSDSDDSDEDSHRSRANRFAGTDSAAYYGNKRARQGSIDSDVDIINDDHGRHVVVQHHPPPHVPSAVAHGGISSPSPTLQALPRLLLHLKQAPMPSLSAPVSSSSGEGSGDMAPRSAAQSAQLYAESPLSNASSVISRPSSSLAFDSEEEAASTPQSSYRFSCLCGIEAEDYDDGTEMVGCAACRSRAHAACIEDEAREGEYICAPCMSKGGPRA